MDEVLVEPYRAATLIGAKDPSTDGSAWSSANAAIGPLQVDKMFYGTTTSLPSSYSSSQCANLPAAVTCVLAYKVADTNVASFVSSIPAGANTIMVWYQEPEGNSFSSCEGVNKGSNGANFVCEFEHQADLIRANVTSANRANVWVAMDAGGYQYGTGRNGPACAFTRRRPPWIFTSKTPMRIQRTAATSPAGAQPRKTPSGRTGSAASARRTSPSTGCTGGTTTASSASSPLGAIPTGHKPYSNGRPTRHKMAAEPTKDL